MNYLLGGPSFRPHPLMRLTGSLLRGNQQNKLDNSDLYHVGEAYRRMAEGNVDEAMEILSRHFDLAPPRHERAIADLLSGKRN